MRKRHSIFIGATILLLLSACELQPFWDSPYLTSLKLVDDSTGDELSLTPPFDPGIQQYDATVPVTVMAVELAAEAFPYYGTTTKVEGKPLVAGETVTLTASVWTDDQWHPTKYVVTVHH